MNPSGGAAHQNQVIRQPDASELKAPSEPASTGVVQPPGRSISLIRELLALAGLVLVTLISFRDAIWNGRIVYEKDTQIFFYPLAAWFSEEIKAGRFPLWNPYIFAGYPMFADGESGMAYPLHLLLLSWLSGPQTFVWLRVSSVLAAAVGAYALARALHLGRAAGIIAGLTFAFGSFFASQQHHENITRTAAWLPLLLAFVEWGVQRRGWPRQALLVGAACVLGISALGLHPQMLAMNLLAFSTYVVFRGIVGPDPPAAPSRAWWLLILARVGRTIWVGCFVGILGLGLAAIQLVPLVELGSATYRGLQPAYDFATSYALPIFNLVDLVFPYFFRGPEADYWSLWAKWETTLYVGILPLGLGLLGLLQLRRREVWFFSLMAVGSLWLAFASYAPFDLYGLLWSLPGFSAFRVPGRYTYLFVLAWAILAAFGYQALADSRTHKPKVLQILFALLFLAAGGTLIALVLGLDQVREGLIRDPGSAYAWIESSYLSQRHHLEGLQATEVYRGLVHSLNLLNPRTTAGLALLGLALATLWGMTMAGKIRAISQGVALLLVAGDLLSFGSSLHTTTSLAELSAPTPALQFLREQISSDTGGAPGQLGDQWRIFSPVVVPSLEVNRLVPFHVEDMDGYSSPDLRRNVAYSTTLGSIQNRLLDLANIRYLVYPAVLPSKPSYRTVPFDPERPLMLGSKDSLGGNESFTMHGVHANRLQIVAALTRAAQVPQDDVVAEITVISANGAPATFAMRAGRQVAEWAMDRPDVRPIMKHGQPEEIAFRRPDTFLLDGSSYFRYLYYSEYDLPGAMDVERVEVRYVHPIGGIEVYGMGFYNFETQQTAGVGRTMRTKLQESYTDAEVQIFTNTTAFPRAYIVPSARFAAPGESLPRMLDSSFDPVNEVMLESPTPLPDQARAEVPVASPTPPPAQLLFSASDLVIYRAEAPQGGYLVHVANYFPGWKAAVDGQPAPVILANSLFRAVPLAPGRHVVELRYEPLSFDVGRQISLGAALLAMGILASALLAIVLESWGNRELGNR